MEHGLDFYVKNFHMLISTVLLDLNPINHHPLKQFSRKAVIFLNHSLNKKQLN